MYRHRVKQYKQNRNFKKLARERTRTNQQPDAKKKKKIFEIIIERERTLQKCLYG